MREVDWTLIIVTYKYFTQKLLDLQLFLVRLIATRLRIIIGIVTRVDQWLRQSVACKTASAIAAYKVSEFYSACFFFFFNIADFCNNWSVINDVIRGGEPTRGRVTSFIGGRRWRFRTREKSCKKVCPILLLLLLHVWKHTARVIYSVLCTSVAQLHQRIPRRPDPCKRVHEGCCRYNSCTSQTWLLQRRALCDFT